MRKFFFSIFLGAGLEVKRMGAVDFKDPAAGIGSELFQKI